MIESYTHEDFIGIYETQFNTQPLIDYFKFAIENKVVFSRRQDLSQQGGFGAPNARKDSMLALNYFTDYSNPPAPIMHTVLPSTANSEYIRAYNEVMEYCLNVYAQEYEQVTAYQLQCPYVNVQRSLPKQGYHVWHCEDSGPSTTTRVLVNMMYLNDDFDGGETEFLYQSKRIQPKKGRVLIWPAAFTHTHRGNPPLSNEKYIATAWFTNVNY